MTIGYARPGFGATSFDFAFDSVTFNQPLRTTVTSEPASLHLLGTGVLAITGMLRRKLFSA